MSGSAYLNLLRNHIDISRVPFSDRGSRLLIYQEGDQSKLMVKLAERLTELQPGVTAFGIAPQDNELVDSRWLGPVAIAKHS